MLKKKAFWIFVIIFIFGCGLSSPEPPPEEDIQSRFDSNNSNATDFVPIRKLTRDFRDFLNEEMDYESERINTKWVGLALKRLGLIKDKRRMNTGREVMLNLKKARAMSLSYGVKNE